MRRLTTRQKFALSFTLYIFSFLIILYTLFFVIFTFMSNYQMRKDLSDDIREIVDSHLLLDNKEIIFRKDKQGASLRQFLINENSSAIIIDSKKSIVRSYGSFTFNDPNRKQYESIIVPLVNQVAKTKLLKETQIIWNKENFKTVIVPLQSKNTFIGTLVLAKSMTDFYGIQQIIIAVFLTLGILSLSGSFIVGYALARRTLNPLIKLAKVVEGMDLDRFDTILQVEGHPQDELVFLVQRFNDMMDRLRDMASRQKEFIANASHELKTPLTRAITSLEVLESSPNISTEIPLIKEDLFHINDLLNKLLLLTKLKKSSHSPTKIHTINVEKILHTIRKQFKDQLEKKHITLSTTFPNFIVTILPYEYLEIILSNLISNSIKYSASGKTITVTTKTSGSHTAIEIQDQGIGMNDEEIRHMFDRFYRGKTLSNKERGYGIGLSIVKQICDIYNIDMNVSSQKEKGTKISFDLT